MSGCPQYCQMRSPLSATFSQIQRRLPLPSCPRHLSRQAFVDTQTCAQARAGPLQPRRYPHRRHRRVCLSRSTEVEESPPSGTTAGEDAAAFDPAQQSTAKWSFFTAELAVVLAIMYGVSWIFVQQCCRTPVSQLRVNDNLSADMDIPGHRGGNTPCAPAGGCATKLACHHYAYSAGLCSYSQWDGLLAAHWCGWLDLPDPGCAQAEYDI